MPIATYFSFLCTEIWPSYIDILKIQDIPFLFLSSQRDELIPVKHHLESYNLAPMKSKMYAHVSKGTHNNAWTHQEYWEQFQLFWDSNLATRFVGLSSELSVINL